MNLVRDGYGDNVPGDINATIEIPACSYVFCKV
jgi:hypothetical protein